MKGLRYNAAVAVLDPFRKSLMFDYILVGGGLQSALVLLALRTHRPGARVAMVERGSRLGGNHTWCFHATDISDSARDWVEPLIVKRWDGYDVRFPDAHHQVDRQYACISSERLHEVVAPLFEAQDQLLVDQTVTRIESSRVRLADGTELEAPTVIDARGPAMETTGSCGFQKFYGLELRTAEPHPWDRPLLMDATVDQQDGFRFLYVLPFDRHRVLLEETFFNDTAQLDTTQSRRAIEAYAAQAGIREFDVLREEEGVLPMPWESDFPAPDASPLRAGYHGGFFHPATGYSFPVAVRLAELIATRKPEQLFTDGALQSFWTQHQKQVAFCHRLNAMLFQWFAPQDRWHVYARFYGLPQETIDRFYALQMRTVDQGRLLIGRPPRGFSLRYRLSRRADSGKVAS